MAIILFLTIYLMIILYIFNWIAFCVLKITRYNSNQFYQSPNFTATKGQKLNYSQSHMSCVKPTYTEYPLKTNIRIGELSTYFFVW